MKLKITLVFVLLSLLMAGCNTWKKYTISAGSHSTGDIGKPLVDVDEIEFEFKTNDTWYYEEVPNPGWNKIRGFSYGHHQNNSSARLGYQCLHDTLLVVGAYCYADGVSPQENPDLKGIIDTIQPGQLYHCKIRCDQGKYRFYFGGKYWECPAGEELSWGYLLNPYIGGEFTLEHEWNTEIKDIQP